MENKRSIEYYDSRVRDVKLEDITSSEYNARALRKLRDNDPNFTLLSFTDDADVDMYDVLVRDNDDMGWLGYFIGRNSQLKILSIWPWLEDIDESRIEALFQGISLNRSISEMNIYPGWGGFFLQRLSNFFRSNKNLTQIGLLTSDVGLETARQLAVDLRDMSLESFLIDRLCYDSDSDSFIDEGAVTAEVIAALATHNNIERLDLRTCNLDRSACMALGRLSSLKELTLIDSVVADEEIVLAGDISCRLESLEISHMDYEEEVVALISGLSGLHSLKKLKLRNSIGDDSLQRLVTAIANNTMVEVLDLSQNASITAKGLSSLSSLLQSDKCCLRELVLHNMHIGDDGAAALAEALTGNKSLKRLNFYDPSMSDDVVATGMTTAGWSTLTRLLCDTSSINNTYLSNHTLERCNTAYDERMAAVDLGYYLSINKSQQHVAMYKILSNHPDFDMKPLFQWQLKFLPLIIAWFKTTRARCPVWIEPIDSLQRREISAIFQFVRGLPLLTAAGWRNQKLTDTGSKKRKLDHL